MIYCTKSKEQAQAKVGELRSIGLAQTREPKVRAGEFRVTQKSHTLEYVVRWEYPVTTQQHMEAIAR